MSVESKIQDQIKEAMKAKDTETLSTLRMLKAAIDNEKIAKKTEDLPDDAILAIIQKQVKQRQDSVESFENAGRTEMAEKEKKEITILQVYLPAQLSDEELKSIVEGAIKESGASSKADMGKVMQVVMPKVKGKADGKRVNAVLSGLLS